ncbi:MAG TPA: hypothetical protein VN841_24185 [Bryobacteraceae bacterium]|nr:hypothetical protein [Bryobacteraceae bacterium]
MTPYGNSRLQVERASQFTRNALFTPAVFSAAGGTVATFDLPQNRLFHGCDVAAGWSTYLPAELLDELRRKVPAGKDRHSSVVAEISDNSFIGNALAG